MDSTVNIERNFDVVKSDGTVIAIGVKQLTLRQLRQRGDMFVEKIRSDNRTEAIAIANQLPEKERVKFLVESARANVSIDPEKAKDINDTVWGILQTVALGCSKYSYEQLFDIFDMCNESQFDLMRYHALGVDVDELLKAIESTKKKEGETVATSFPSTSADVGPNSSKPM